MTEREEINAAMDGCTEYLQEVAIRLLGGEGERIARIFRPWFHDNAWTTGDPTGEELVRLLWCMETARAEHEGRPAVTWYFQVIRDAMEAEGARRRGEGALKRFVRRLGLP